METKNVQTGWNATIADGYIARGSYGKPEGQDYDTGAQTIRNPLPGLATALGQARRDFFNANIRRIRTDWTVFGANLECDHLAFSMPKGGVQDKDSPLAIENEPGLVYLLQLHRNYPLSRECFLDIMSQIGFHPKAESEYKGLTEFDAELEHLTRQILKDYPYTEPVAGHLLAHRGFKVVRPWPTRMF